MGADTCSSTLTCRASDAPVFAAIDFEPEWRPADEPPVDSTRGLILEHPDCPSAAYDDLHDVAKTGVPFYGYHSAGFEYPEGVFAAADGLIAWIDCLNGSLAVRVDETGQVNADDLREIQRYLALEKRAKALIAGTED